MNKFLKLIFVGVFILPVVAHATVTQLVFTTEPITVAPGAISEGLTVSSGEAVGEISDLALVSSSATGEFLNSSGAIFRPTWNSNWANRTFYYRDSTAGNYTITATLTTRASQQSWPATQTITVGDSAPENNNNDNSDDNDQASSGSNNNSSSSNNNNSLSSHSAVAELSDFKNSPTLKAGAGRARLTAIYSPVAFKASVPDDFKNSKTKFNWAFGDGASGRGGSIKHAYEAPGNYQVVLNAENGEEEATARSTVKVFKPDLHLGYDLNGGSLMLTLVSRSAEELNIGGWQLSSMGKVFTFPPDTIIAGKAELALSAGIIGFTPAPKSAILNYPNGQVATEILPNQSLSREELIKMIDELKTKIAKLKQ
ncbi:MAG: PKD domain-containing protein [Patescibacteria group bacterium]